MVHIPPESNRPQGSHNQPIQQHKPTQGAGHTQPTDPKVVQDLSNLKDSIAPIKGDVTNVLNSAKAYHSDPSAKNMQALNSAITNLNDDMSEVVNCFSQLVNDIVGDSHDSKSTLSSVKNSCTQSNFFKDLHNIQDNHGNSMMELLESGDKNGMKKLLTTLTETPGGQQQLSSLGKDSQKMGTDLGNMAK